MCFAPFQSRNPLPLFTQRHFYLHYIFFLPDIYSLFFRQCSNYLSLLAWNRYLTSFIAISCKLFSINVVFSREGYIYFYSDTLRICCIMSLLILELIFYCSVWIVKSRASFLFEFWFLPNSLVCSSTIMICLLLAVFHILAQLCESDFHI